MAIFLKPGEAWTEHLQGDPILDHRQMLDRVWQMRARPGVADFFKGMEYWHNMGALDQADFARFMGGKIAGKDVRLVAVMPPHVAAMLHEHHPDILKDRAEFARFLREHPEYSVPS